MIVTLPNRDYDTIGLVAIVKECPPPEWERIFKEHIDEIEHIEQIIKNMGTYYPRPSDVFNAFYYTPLSKVRVVIIGQDPYHTQGANAVPTAMGLSFSSRPGDSIPQSLENIYTEMVSDLSETDNCIYKYPANGDLRHLASQGVLLINLTLTVQPGKAKSHGSCWLPLIKPVLETISTTRPKAIFLLWGNDAKKAKNYITNPVLEANHPSPLSANKGFFGCKHFSKVNTYLKEHNESKINWLNHDVK